MNSPYSPDHINKETIFIDFGIIFIALPLRFSYNISGWYEMKKIVNGNVMTKSNITKSNKLDTLIRDVNFKKNKTKLKIKGGFKMVEQANVCVKNFLLGKEIQVVRKLADGSQDLNKTIAYGNEDTTLLPEPGVFLLISPVGGVDTGTCPFNVRFNDHLVSYEALDGHWKVQLTANEDEPEVPTDVNIEIGEEPPNP